MFCPPFFITCFLPFSPLSSMAFCTISSRFLHFMHFQYIFPRVLPVSFSFQSFLHHFLWLLSHFPALSLYFSSMFTASSFVPSSRSGSSMFQQILHPLFWLLSHFPARLLSHFLSLYLSSIFQWILHDFL